VASLLPLVALLAFHELLPSRGALTDDVGAQVVNTLATQQTIAGQPILQGTWPVRWAPVEPLMHRAWVDVHGPGDRGGIARVLREHDYLVGLCYAAGSTEHPELRGRVAVRFAIDLNGDVETTSVSSDTDLDSGVANCVCESMLDLSFPRSLGVVFVEYSFELYPFRPFDPCDFRRRISGADYVRAMGFARAIIRSGSHILNVPEQRRASGG
jgi:hypothetical protein